MGLAVADRMGSLVGKAPIYLPLSVYAGGLDHGNVLRVETEFLLRCAAEASHSD